MTFVDYVIDILLIAVVFGQMRARKLTPGSVLLPVVLVAIACLNYLKAFTPRGNDGLLITLLAAAGIVVGLLSGIVTDVRRDADGRVVARAGLAAAFWVAGIWASGPPSPSGAPAAAPPTSRGCPSSSPAS